MAHTKNYLANDYPKGHEWKKGLSEIGRCGTCLFIEGGWEVEFMDVYL